MPITEYQRNQLFNWFEEHMGKERADTMMSLLPPVGWADVATKHDLDALEQRIDAKFEVVDARFEAVDARFDALEERFDARFDALGHRISSEIAQTKLELQRTFVPWLFTAQGVVVAAIGLMIAYLR